MFTYATEKNRFGDEHIAVFVHGSQIAEIKPSSYYGKNEYIVSATTGDDDRGDYLGRASTIAGAKKKIRDWYSENGGGVGVRPKPKYDMDAMYAQYPRAKAYLDAQEFAASENDAKSAAGRKALEAIISGENHEQVIAAMNSEWAAHCEAHLWD